ncbi:hypothetical protein DLAC_05817 [Tieghemostelium lacteum]|uniref:PH domain-containing protein n=1 Tax=Tieghemostelium lacteum TaxID=361077 RepID=A0A151ZGT0_TIELA|nr:hypothetical protein DLAC_05817 [Tieghemostelium lacteum]|eukprot:KYQ93181.1 hypothetical protein DLAC_05817 [Tieghemostelium lacteum]
MAETFINKTIETNNRFQKPNSTKNKYTDTITHVIKICLEDHSLTKVNSLKSLLPDIDQVVLKESPICGYLMYILADSCRKSNLYEDSINYGKQSLKIREVLYGEDSNEVCICLDLLSLSMVENEQYEQSSKHFLSSFKRKAIGGFTTCSQLILDTNKFISQLRENYQVKKKQLLHSNSLANSHSNSSGNLMSPTSATSQYLQQIQQQQQLTSKLTEIIEIIITTLSQSIDILQKIYQESLKDPNNPELSNDLKKSFVSLSLDLGKILSEQSKFTQVCDSYKSLLTFINNTGSKEEKLIYELLIQSLLRIDQYDQVKNYINLFIGMAVKYYKLPSIELASVLWFCGKSLEEQSDKHSPTKLCDLVDSLRYYLCTLKISREIGGVTIGEESTAVAQKKIRDKIETLLYNNRPLKPEEVVTLVDAMIRVTTTDFLLNSAKSQNWLLKYVYPDFMAEDALREKFETLPQKSGFLSKINGLMKSWKTRWFSLERDILSYYKYNNDPKPQGELQILEIKSIDILPKDKKFKPYVHCFQIVHPKHTLILAAENEEVMKEWVAVLGRAKQYWEDWSNISLNIN